MSAIAARRPGKVLRAVAPWLVVLLAGGCAGVGAPQQSEPAPAPAATPQCELAAPDAPAPTEPVVLAARATAPALSYDVGRRLRRPPNVAGNLDAPLKRRWKYIVLHHSDGDAGSEAAFDRYHREERHWRGVGYDFVIGNGHGSRDGLVEVTFRWERQLDGAHAGVAEYNKHGIGICLVGDFEKGYPTAKQMEALVGLVNYLQERCKIPTANIMGHRHVKPTRCPGRNFPWYNFFALLEH